MPTFGVCGHDGVLDDILLLVFPAWFEMHISVV